MSFRRLLAWLLAWLIVDATESSSQVEESSSLKASGMSKQETELTGCTDHNNPFQVQCTELVPKQCELFRCASEGEYWSFSCENLESGFSCGEDQNFQCDSVNFHCIGKFTCNHTEDDYACDGEVFNCGPSVLDGFQCKYDSSSFNCSEAGGETDLFDFWCDRAGSTLGYDCLPQASFECSGKHIFLCHTHFTCPTSHTCKCIGECSDIHPWEPIQEDDDGNPGDFDCNKFTCGRTRSENGGGSFECGGISEEGASSQFKCFDGSQDTFACGDGFECGEETEGFVCWDYSCPSPFDCIHEHVCRKRGVHEDPGFNCETFNCVTTPGHGASDMFHCSDEGESPDFECGEDPEDFDCAERKFNCGYVEYLCAAETGFECPEEHECNVEGQDFECSAQFECTSDFGCTHAHDCAEHFNCHEFSCCIVAITPDDKFSCPPEGFTCDSFTCGEGWHAPHSP